ncbi:MAG: fused MFS/spermidine synthase [Coriobacteriia bacterium]|nr:fused MFS/spermidine synthase [Coriobacteriia bacterium]
MYEQDSAYHKLKVIDHDGVRSLKFERNHQSSMSLADPFETDIEYVGYLHLTLAVKHDAEWTLVLGLGGGSVVKRMWRDYPAMHIDVVELDPDVVEIAHELFALPLDERITVTVADGRDFVATSDDIYDIIIVDAFDDDRVPRQLMTEEFMRTMRDCLAPDGVVAYNFIGSLHDGKSRAFRSLYRTASNVWRQLWVFAVGHDGNAIDGTDNIVMLATDRREPADAFLERIASRAGGLVSVPGFERFGEDLYRGPIRAGDVPLLLDEPSARQRHQGRKRR